MDSTKKIVTLSFMTAVLFSQQLLLFALPNIQFSFLLVVVYAKAFGTKETMTITFLHVVANTILYGGFMYVLAPFMILGYWSVIAIVNLALRRQKNSIILATGSFIGSLTYSWILAIPSIFIFDINWKVYMMADIPWELVLGLTSFITVLLLFDPLYNLLSNYKHN